MDQIRSYILSVITSALICAVIMKLNVGKGTQSEVVKMIAALYLAFCVISPITGIDIRDITSYIPELQADGDSAAAQGEGISRAALREGIKERTEAYILDKALELGAEVVPIVTVSQEDIPVPESVCIEGEVSPYVKTKLTIILENELGIPREAQTWI